MKPIRTPFRLDSKERKGVLFLLIVFFTLRSMVHYLELRLQLKFASLSSCAPARVVSDLADSIDLSIPTRRKPNIQPKLISTSTADLLGDINEADTLTLRKIRGIGPVLSNRIVRYRSLIGTFSSFSELNNVYGLKPEVIDRIEKRFTLAVHDSIKPINLRTASRIELLKLPFLTSGEVDWLLAIRNSEEGLGTQEDVTNLLLNTLNKNKSFSYI